MGGAALRQGFSTSGNDMGEGVRLDFVSALTVNVTIKVRKLSLSLSLSISLCLSLSLC
jgi:hypothetical protein